MTDPVIRSFLQNRRFNDVASYIARGRLLRPLSDDGSTGFRVFTDMTLDEYLGRLEHGATRLTL